MEVIADTTVLIDLWRYRKTPRRLADLTGQVGESAILVPWITQAEFARGALFKDVSLEALAEFYASFPFVAAGSGHDGYLLPLVGGHGAGGSRAGLPGFVDCGLRGGKKKPCPDTQPETFLRGAGTGCD
jgi:hypothetical protein